MKSENLNFNLPAQDKMHAEFDVFLSHSSIDKLWVKRLKDLLIECGLNVWLDQDEIRPGDLFVHALEQGLESSHTVALIISPEAMASGWVREEYARAVSLAQRAAKPLRLIPVILREAELPASWRAGIASIFEMRCHLNRV